MRFWQVQGVWGGIHDLWGMVTGAAHTGAVMVRWPIQGFAPFGHVCLSMTASVSTVLTATCASSVDSPHHARAIAISIG